MLIPRLAPKYLLLLAALVWAAAGGNILRIGVVELAVSWQHHFSYLLLSLFVFLLFMGRIFYQLVQKHFTRIREMKEPAVPFYLFFDKKSYWMMLLMMGGGLLLRSAHLLPPLAIGILYCGIGAALSCAGILFFQKFLLFFRVLQEKAAVPEEDASSVPPEA